MIAFESGISCQPFSHWLFNSAAKLWIVISLVWFCLLNWSNSFEIQISLESFIYLSNQQRMFRQLINSTDFNAFWKIVGLFSLCRPSWCYFWISLILRETSVHSPDTKSLFSPNTSSYIWGGGACVKVSKVRIVIIALT